MEERQLTNQDPQQQDLPDGWKRASAGPVELGVPVEWSELGSPHMALALRHPDVPEGHFQPNVVVREMPYAGTLPALAAFALSTTRATMANARFIANDELELAGVEGRVQRFTYDGGGHSLVVDRYLAVRNGRALEITGTTSLEFSVDMLATFSAMAGTIAWSESPQTPTTGDSGAATGDADSVDVLTGIREPRHDPFLSGMAGHPVEDLSKLAAIQGYGSEGPVVSAATVDFLQEQRNRRKLGRFDMMQNHTAISELTDAGLLHADGSFAPGLEVMLAPWRDTEVVVRLGSVHAGRESSLTLHVGGGRALAQAGASANDLVHGPGPQRMVLSATQTQIDLVQTAGVPAVIASWVGLGPAGSVAGNITRIRPERYRQRLDGPTEAPEGADEASRRMWNEPWVGWGMAIEDSPFERSWLNAGAAGHYLVGLDDDGWISLEPVPSAQVWDVIVQEFGVSLTHVVPGGRGK